MSSGKYKNFGDFYMNWVQKLIKNHCDLIAGIGIGLMVGALISVIVLLAVI
jgi:hypothetical protein